jgi:hypothetical protein
VGLALYGMRRQRAGSAWTETSSVSLGRWGRRLIGWLSEVL